MTERSSTGIGGLFARPNLPYLLVFGVAVAATAAFLVLHGLEPDSTVAGGQETTTTTQAVGSGTTVTTEATTTSTDPAETTTTVEETTTTSGDGTLQALSLEILATGLPQPTYATAIPGTDALAVLERQGRVVVVEGDGGGLAADPYLDLVDRVGSGGIENGLLGLAFHPDFAENGRLFVYYTDADLDTRLSEFTADPAGTTIDAGTEQILLEYDQQGIRHRGGMLQFGPDGYLYVAIGDGGVGDRSAQDTDNVLGTISRIDVDGDPPYGIPPENPFADGGGAPELWLHGLRNPWRFAIDAESGLIYVADVGQENWEEIDIYPLDGEGADFGWPDFEGTHCYLPSESCDQGGWEAPVYEYSHEDGCAVTGGFVYRGAEIPEVAGEYFFADWCNGWVKSFTYADGAIGDVTTWAGDLSAVGQVASFGLDAEGELLVVTSEGTVARIVAVR